MVRNTFVQGTLSIVFLVLSVIVIIAAIITTIRAFPHGGPDTEDPALPSRIYAPAGIVPTAAEKELDARWNALPARLRALNYKGH